MSTYKSSPVDNSSELYFHSCTEVLTASRSYTEIFFFLNSPHVAQTCNRSQCSHCMSTTRRALLHSAHIYTVSPNSGVLLYKILLYLCVLTVVMFIQCMSIDICIYNTASLTKNNSTITFIIHSCVLCLLIITIIMIARITKHSCVSNRTETAGRVRNETVCLLRSELHCFLVCECQLVYPEVKHFVQCLKKRERQCGAEEPSIGFTRLSAVSLLSVSRCLKVFKVHLEYSLSAMLY